METNIGITDANRQLVAEELNKVLADENVLYTKTKNAHWNLEGVDFYEKHKFFESQFTQLADVIDDTAERIRALGHFAVTSLKSTLELTHLTEEKSEDNDSQGFIKELLSDQESIIIHLREKIALVGDTYKDLGTADFMTGLMELHEKMAWFLRSHLK